MKEFFTQDFTKGVGFTIIGGDLCPLCPQGTLNHQTINFAWGSSVTPNSTIITIACDHNPNQELVDIDKSIIAALKKILENNSDFAKTYIKGHDIMETGTVTGVKRLITFINTE
jgi:hypothetical protein